jgi:hypothetical protein
MTTPDLVDEYDRLFTSEQELLAENARLRALLAECRQCQDLAAELGNRIDAALEKKP